MAGGQEARTENLMRVDPARQQMRRTGMLADSMVNIVQDIARDTSRRLVGSEDCWIHVQYVRCACDIIVRTTKSVVPTECYETFLGKGGHGSYDTQVQRGCE